MILSACRMLLCSSLFSCWALPLLPPVFMPCRQLQFQSSAFAARTPRHICLSLLVRAASRLGQPVPGVLLEPDAVSLPAWALGLREIALAGG